MMMPIIMLNADAGYFNSSVLLLWLSFFWKKRDKKLLNLFVCMLYVIFSFVSHVCSLFFVAVMLLSYPFIVLL